MWIFKSRGVDLFLQHPVWIITGEISQVKFWPNKLTRKDGFIPLGVCFFNSIIMFCNLWVKLGKFSSSFLMHLSSNKRPRYDGFYSPGVYIFNSIIMFLWIFKIYVLWNEVLWIYFSTSSWIYFSNIQLDLFLQHPVGTNSPTSSCMFSTPTLFLLNRIKTEFSRKFKMKILWIFKSRGVDFKI